MTSLRIAVIGAGYVGLVTSACLADLGFKVTCMDNNLQVLSKLQNGIMPFFEPGLRELVLQTVDQGRLSFTYSLREALCEAHIVFIAVGTPAESTGAADLFFVQKIIHEVVPLLSEETIVVLKSTVPVGTNRSIAAKIQTLTSRKIHVVSNPEFLREGAALQDFMKPDRIIVGASHPKAEQIMRQLYRSFVEKNVPLLFMDWETAELIKYASNSFLALKVGFVNEIANLCEVSGADIQEVTQGMGLDHRIGTDFLKPGPGYGGSCFPKDTEALVHVAQNRGVNLSLIKTLIQSNTQRKHQMAQKIIEACGGAVGGKTLGILGITFKAETDDLRESPSLVILPFLQNKGAALSVYDPQGAEKGVKVFKNVHWCSHMYEAATGADALVILTEWEAFKSPDWARLKELLKTPLIIDLRNLYNPKTMKKLGFHYVGVGRA